MDRLTFWAEIVKALAWPVAAVVLALLARGPLRGLIQGLRLKKVKRGDWEAEFNEAAAEVLAELPASPKQAPPGTRDSEGLAAELAPMVDASPTGAILAAWNRIEVALTAIALREGILDRPFGLMLNELGKRNALARPTLKAVSALRQLRNLAVHGGSGEVSTARAREFLTMAEAVLWNIDSGPGASGKT